MKTLTPSQVTGLLDAILTDKEKAASTIGQPFTGLSSEDAFAEIGRRVSDKWMIHRPTALQWAKADFNSVANNRFLRGTGLMLLMGLCIVLLVLSIITTTFAILPLWVYEILVIIVAGIFVLVFSRKRTQARRAFFEDMQAHGYNFPWLSQELNKKRK